MLYPLLCYRPLCLPIHALQVHSLDEKHTRLGAAPVNRGRSSQQGWLQRIFPSTLSATKTTTPRLVIDAVALHHKVQIKLQKGKGSSFGRLPIATGRTVWALARLDGCYFTNQREISCCFQTEDYDGVQRFHRIFLCPGVSRGPFLHCRSLLAMDEPSPRSSTSPS